MARSFAMAALALCAVALLAGCASTTHPSSTPSPAAPAAPSYDGLQASDPKTTTRAGDVLQYGWDGVTGTGASAILVTRGTPDPLLKETFEVDSRVGYVEANISLDPSKGSVVALVTDDQGRLQCGAVNFLPHTACTVPIPASATKVTWTLTVRTAYEMQPHLPTGQLQSPVTEGQPGQPFHVTLGLHPPSHITRGDPLAGVDPAISFRISDTKHGGGEDNVGVLPDGSVWTQANLATLKSTDDGRTWKDVGPATTSAETLDPMLYVDAARSTVYVDQLYVACSVLAWSKDAGATWVSNPAACGGPGDDHQKLGVGPNPVPAAPFPAVYYSYSSFAEGVWVSRSLDGGATFTTAPVVGVGDNRLYANDGPVYADTKGNVYVPLYMCDNGGSVGVGVSNDYGMTFRYVQVSAENEACTDVDPGLGADTAGNVYFAYHRPSGIQYASSTDHGATWSAPVTVSPPQQKSFVHVDAVAGDPGRLAIVYRATPDSAKGPDGADGWAGWHTYMAFVQNATSAHPTVKVGIVGDPVRPDQRGPICTQGVACAGNSRNLLDFIDVAVGPDGRVYTSYSVGCLKVCATPGESRQAEAFVGIEENGPRLFEGKAA